MTKVVIEAGSYKLEAVEQSDPGVWLVREYSGEGQPINTYGATTETLLGHVRSIVKTR